MILCDFSTGISDLTRKQKQNPLIVLYTIMNNPRINTWEMGEHGLWRTVDKLVKAGYLEVMPEPYPYHRYKMTDAGYKFLEDNKV